MYFVFLIVCMVIFFVGTFTVQLDTAKLVPGITVGGLALGPSLSFPRVMSLPINITGTLLLFGGAAWSVWRFARRRAACRPGVARPPRRHRRPLPGGNGRRGADARRVPACRYPGQGRTQG